MRMLDLFSGIGGFALAAEWTWGNELDIVGFCEIGKYAQKVLQKNFPGVPIHEDITKLNGKDFKNIDLITGGFPCQDISIAGKGEGIEGKRSGLWTEMCRIISEVRPRYAIIENVPMLIHRGLERVLCDLTEIGYDCEWQIIGADDVGAWHRRKRIWIVAYANRNRTEWDKSENGTGRRFEQSGEDDTQRHSLNSDTNRIRSHQKRININRETQLCNKQDSISGPVGGEVSRSKNHRQNETADVPNTEYHGSSPTDGQREKIESPKQTRTKSIGELKRRSDLQEVPDTIGKRGCGWDTQRQDAENAGELRRSPKHGYWNIEPNVGRVANGVPNRVDRLKGLGNAIVPQVAYEIMKCLT